MIEISVERLGPSRSTYSAHLYDSSRRRVATIQVDYLRGFARYDVVWVEQHGEVCWCASRCTCRYPLVQRYRRFSLCQQDDEHEFSYTES